AVALVAALGFWDHQRESAAALDDFAQEQATLAGSVAAELGTRLATGRKEALLEGALRVERPGTVRLLLLAPGDAPPRGTDGGTVESPPVERAVAAGKSSVWLSRAEAAALGLPERRAAAGLARTDAALGAWAVAVVTTAERVRDREMRASYRLALAV